MCCVAIFVCHRLLNCFMIYRKQHRLSLAPHYRPPVHVLFRKTSDRKPRFHSGGLHVNGGEVGNGKQEPRGEEVSIMRPLQLRSSLGCLVTVFGSFSASRNKLVTQAAAAPHLYYFRKTMHYQTEERGHPHSPDYRIYFSKLIIAAPAFHSVPV